MKVRNLEISNKYVTLRYESEVNLLNTEIDEILTLDHLRVELDLLNSKSKNLNRPAICIFKNFVEKNLNLTPEKVKIAVLKSLEKYPNLEFISFNPKKMELTTKIHYFDKMIF